MLQRGTIIGGTYEIMEEIGSGGGGIVYKARHIRLETDVVVKKIRDEVRNKIQSRQEADVLKKLKHPYLPRVYDFIEMPEGVFTVMDFVPGIPASVQYILHKAVLKYSWPQIGKHHYRKLGRGWLHSAMLCKNEV